jgi:hypothetical protein
MAEKEKERVGLNIDHGEHAFFTDNATVLHNSSKFILDFSQTIPKLDNINGKMQQTFTIKHNTVLMDPQFAKSFLDILTKNMKSFEKKFGKIKLPQAKKVSKKKPLEAESTRYIG